MRWAAKDRSGSVGAAGFEPATSCSQSTCATRLRYAPLLCSDSTSRYRVGMRSRSGSRSTGSTVLSVALLIAIAGFAVLVGLQVRGDHPAKFDVAEAQGIECPVGEGSPACFSFGVTNLGSQPSLVECIATAPTGQATFLNDMPIYTSSAPFEAGVTEQLIVKVDQGEEGAVAEPTVICRAL